MSPFSLCPRCPLWPNSSSCSSTTEIPARPSAGAKINSHKATKRRPYPGIAYFVIFVASCEYHYLALSPCSQCPPWFNHPRNRVFDPKTAFGPPATPHFTLETSHCQLKTPHFTLTIPHFQLETGHFTLKTSHCQWKTGHCQLKTPHCQLETWHCQLNL